MGFGLFIIVMMALDLGVFHRRSHEAHLKEALAWSRVWISLALLFNAGIYFLKGPQKSLEFFTGYLVELSLSVDNLFVFLLIFTYFRVPAQYQHKVLFWGILGALVMRAVFVAAGVTLLGRFAWEDAKGHAVPALYTRITRAYSRLHNGMLVKGRVLPG